MGEGEIFSGDFVQGASLKSFSPISKLISDVDKLILKCVDKFPLIYRSKKYKLVPCFS
jgi:hypothetical protein